MTMHTATFLALRGGYVSSSSSSSKTKRSVRFSSMSELYTYPNDTTTDNAEADTNSAIWYTSEDQQRFRRDAKDDASSYLTKRATKQAEAKRTDLPVDHIEPPPFGLELQLVSKEHTQKRVMTRKLHVLLVDFKLLRLYEIGRVFYWYLLLLYHNRCSR